MSIFLNVTSCSEAWDTPDKGEEIACIKFPDNKALHTIGCEEFSINSNPGVKYVCRVLKIYIEKCMKNGLHDIECKPEDEIEKFLK